MLTFSCLASLCKKREIKLILGRGCIKRGFNSMQQSIGQKNVKNIQSTSSPAVISLISIIFHFELNEVSMIFQKA